MLEESSLTFTTTETSSITVPAYTEVSATFITGRDSPVIDASLTVASPSVTIPSIGITLPV